MLLTFVAGAVVSLEVMFLQSLAGSLVDERGAGLTVVVEADPSGVAERPCGVSDEGVMVIGGCVGRLLFSEKELPL